MNADWAKGRNERTGLEGIFPRSYVDIPQKTLATPWQPQPPPPPMQSNLQSNLQSNYSNMQVDVSQGGSSAAPARPESKLQANGKKFGKKMGNAGMSCTLFTILASRSPA